MNLDELRVVLQAALHAALQALDPMRLTRDALADAPPEGGRVLLIAAGKAAPAMAKGAFERWPHRITEALVLALSPLPKAISVDPLGRAKLRAASHPIPDESSLLAAEEALAMASTLTESDHLLALISGGASSLLALPPAGMSLADKQTVVASLLDAGVPIRDVNLVRRHLSRIKGGRLALAAAPASITTLILSDVIAGAPHDVGSGPTIPDPTTVHEARSVLAKVGAPLPAALSESLKPDAPLKHWTRVLADPCAFGHAMALELERRGLRATVDSPEDGNVHTTVERRLTRAATLSPGEAAVIPCEPTLHLPPMRGHGGRAGYVALSAMRRLPPRTALMCAASDGIDGSSGAGGALVMREDAARMAERAIGEALASFNDAAAHRALGTALPGGPTGHNLADVHVLARCW